MLITLFVLALLAPAIVAWFIKPRYLFWVFVTFYLCFGVWELISKLQTGVSISAHFWTLDSINPALAWGFCVAWLAMCIGLILHFKIHKKR